MSDSRVKRKPRTAETSTIDMPVHADEPQKRTALQRVGRFLGRGDGDVARVLILVAIVIVIGLFAPNFLSKASWLALSQTATVVALLALGQTFVIITGGIDLSVGAVMACSAVIGATVMRNMHVSGVEPTLTILAGLAVMLIVGSAAGLLNGLVITKLRITPFIVTLGMLSVATGTMNLVSGGAEVVGLPPVLGQIGNYPLGGWVTVPVLITILAAIVSALVLTRTRFGLRSYAIGSNQGAARRAGIAVDAHLIRVYVLAGLFSGIGGFLLTSRFVNASPLAAQGMELLSIAAAVIGGASLIGGRGSIVGTMIGALIMAALQIGLIVAGVQSFWQTIAIGIITVAAVFGDQIRIRYSGERA
ncbi:monosaccharide ABC transporter membrane protein, CUT2 family [Paramicrobacterium humi]|uniref:Monosaccharide ABC transporter membrane protein, CUT2 family n=1 Tax=Paramicrobacterium humi TaxID=640635 RepID=A0A1H4L8Z1_9MICO|nr:ABC transporter permease [Microbacterium humi]SEB67207.1 monosaccharide ABC transporter membrane protein, CUT2 family [Microbacterium humi]